MVDHPLNMTDANVSYNSLGDKTLEAGIHLVGATRL